MKDILKERIRFRIYWAFALLSLAAGVLLTNTVIQSEVVVILLIAIFGFFFVLLSTRYTEYAGKPSKGIKKYLDFFGKASFTIYVFHLPFIQMFYTLLGQINQDYDVILVYLVSLLSTLSSAAFYFLFEKHTYQVRRFGYKVFHVLL
jgi:peptidoglycan/LPS O-acetylase OafA/YrhL